MTLLPAAQDRGVGAVAVLSTDGGETVLDQANAQASLGSRFPRVRQLTSVDPAYAELINSFPRLIEPQAIRFQTAGTRISTEQIGSLKALLESLGPDLSIYQIEVAGYTDSVGKEQDNLRLSQSRARQVAELLRSEGFKIDDNDIIGRGEYAAVRELGDEKESAQYRAVTIKIR
ncbi:MAG: OmpA family protein [Pseudomonadota bacterium]